MLQTGSLTTRPGAGIGDPGRPHLDLSGPRLTHAFESLVAGSERHGGIERYVRALRLKTQMLQEALGNGRAARLEPRTFKGLCTFVSSVRRRVGPYLEGPAFEAMREAVAELLEGAADTSSTDARMSRFCERFPDDKRHRWVRDLAAEILHGTDPERFPLMCRWVWDRRANTGVIREIWFAENVDNMSIDVEDNYGTFVVLREELSQFLSGNGVFRDVMAYVDLICAQVYADYVCAQGGSYLRADFAAPDDPMHHVRRLLGLDGVKRSSGRTRLKTVDGEAFFLDDVKLLD